ncbi:GNAT family N-acetyltransferase [Saccharopolyspora hirsuta]|uniref:GNAT family N-acetyltransferase n=1 Tax=Saccharopolyspora hirsuta TaxID=1837 RepID=A0A5M7BZD8_SACHI|nr:GNAT family N-acetyltransferase [Saccharopolyspora hirsuta]KAA5832631.1 GNAT family N-acetyltransferase [Saccharopolyspora hirsuta]
MTIRELDDFTPAYPVLRELRPNLGSLEDFLAQAKQQRGQGYRMIAAFDGGEVAAVAGFRSGLCFAWGHHIYVDDLVTAPSARRKGHAAALLAWIDEEALRLGADQVHLDSGTHRHEAHRRYLTSGFAISSFHFTKA